MKSTLFAGLMMLAAGMAGAADLGGAALKAGSDTTSPPMEFVDEATGRIGGFDVDVVNAICAKINFTAEFVTTGWGAILRHWMAGSSILLLRVRQSPTNARPRWISPIPASSMVRRS